MPKTPPIYFLFSQRHASFGSTVMRGQQLSEMVEAHFPDHDVYYTSESDIHNAVVFVTKSLFTGENEEMFRRLKAQGNVILADIVDSKINRLHLDYADVIISASYAGHAYAQKAAGGKPVMRLTHHVDPRIAAGNRAETFSAGYFGEPANAFLREPVAARLRVHHVSTRKQRPRWIRFLPGYNFHYAVRTGKRPDGAKPFTKGFTAAHCAANILVQPSEGDAMEYLGADYPFLLPESWTEADILTALDYAEDAYGGPLWQDGLKRMEEVAARSSTTHIMGEFKAILDAI